jgi:hypothetical protein
MFEDAFKRCCLLLFSCAIAALGQAPTLTSRGPTAPGAINQSQLVLQADGQRQLARRFRRELMRGVAVELLDAFGVL